MCFSGNSDSDPGAGFACTLMSCAAACSPGDYLLFQALIPVGNKQEGKRKETTMADQEVQSPFHQGFFQTTEPPVDLHLNCISIFFFHWMNVNPSMEMGIIHSCFCLGSFGCCLRVGSQRWVTS